MTENPNCPVCGESIRPSDSVARYPEGTCHIRCFGAALWESKRRRRERSQEPSEDARRIRAEAQATRQWARETAKESGQIRDRADVLAREAEAIREQSRRIQRGEQPPK